MSDDEKYTFSVPQKQGLSLEMTRELREIMAQTELTYGSNDTQLKESFPFQDGSGLEGEALEEFKRKRNAFHSRKKRRRKKEFVDRLNACYERVANENKRLKRDHALLKEHLGRAAQVVQRAGSGNLIGSSGQTRSLSTLLPNAPVQSLGMFEPSPLLGIPGAVARAPVATAINAQQQQQDLMSAILREQQAQSLLASNLGSDPLRLTAGSLSGRGLALGQEVRSLMNPHALVDPLGLAQLEASVQMQRDAAAIELYRQNQESQYLATLLQRESALAYQQLPRSLYVQPTLPIVASQFNTVTRTPPRLSSSQPNRGKDEDRGRSR